MIANEEKKIRIDSNFRKTVLVKKYLIVPIIN